MIFLWGANILRHYLDDHPLQLENLKIKKGLARMSCHWRLSDRIAPAAPAKHLLGNG